MGLLRSDIQNEINKAHVKIDELTWLMAKRYNRSQKYQSLADDVFTSLNYIKILQRDDNLTDKEVEWFLQALREVLSLHDVGYQPTTLTFSVNQPAIVLQNLLTVSGTPSVLPKYDAAGTAFEDSGILQSGGSYFFDGSQLFLGNTTTASSGRLLETKGLAAAIDLTIRTSGDMTLQGNTITTPSPVILGQSLKFTSDTVTIESIKDDDTFASPSTTALVTEEAIDTRIDAEVATLNASISSTTYTAGSGMTLTGVAFDLGGSMTKTATLAIAATKSFVLTSPSVTAGFSVVADTSFTLFGPTGSITDNGSTFIVGGAPLDYDIDRSGAYTTRSVPDVNYADTHIGGNLVTALVTGPTVTEHDYSVVWDNSLTRFTLKSVSGGGGAGDADTLDGLDSTQFLRSDANDTTTKKITTDLSALSSTAGANIFNWIISSDNAYARINVARGGASYPTGVEFYSDDLVAYTGVKANTFESVVTTGTAPLTVASTTVVTNLNADLLDGASADAAATNNTIVKRDGTAGIVATALSGITSGTVVTNFNADKVDGFHGTQFMRNDAANTIDYNLTLLDSKKVILGSPSGMSLMHSGSSYIKMESANPIYIQNNSAATIARFTTTASELYYSGSKKIETTSAGATVTGTVTADNFIDTSDIRLKKDIDELPQEIMDKFDLIRPVVYRLIDDPTEHLQAGVIAQEIEQIIPNIIHERMDGYKGVNYRCLLMLTLAKVQELEERVNELEEE